MNPYAETKEEFIKFNNTKKLFKELYNVCLLFKDSSSWYYCSCINLRSGTKKCELCKFDESFDDKSQEKYLITNRNNAEKLQKIVDIYWSYIVKIQNQDRSALNFFEKEYVWTFRDYRNQTEARSELDEIIESNEEIITSSGIRHFLQHYI